jgi:hypothetical protein
MGRRLAIDGRFRRVPTGSEYGLVQRTSFKRPSLSAKFESALDVADPAAPKLARSIVWGIAPNAPAVAVAGTDGADGAATSARSEEREDVDREP